ncbi:MAG: nucleotidyltransferase domain-containing protein [Deltaproteobacteria bacterium]|nr:nucleotidyltransferase domain-containing protein [Deltaproteobacteria bacterium]
MDGFDGLRDIRHALPAEARRLIVERVAKAASDAGGVAAVFLHGSFAGDAPFRDIDLAVLPCRGIPDAGRKAVTDALETAAAPYDVDLRWLDEAPTHFAYRVIAEGRVVWESDPTARADFVEQALIEHFDTAWMRAELLRGALGLDR